MSSYERRVSNGEQQASNAAAEPLASFDARQYAEWELSRERQTHEWKRVRRAIISTRVRLVVFGHLVFFAGCLLIDLLGNLDLSRHFTHIGWFSLLLTSS